MIDVHINDKKKEKTKEHHSYATFEKKWHKQDNKGDCFCWVHEVAVARGDSQWLTVSSDDCFFDLRSRWLIVNVVFMFTLLLMVDSL